MNKTRIFQLIYAILALASLAVLFLPYFVLKLTVNNVLAEYIPGMKSEYSVNIVLKGRELIDMVDKINEVLKSQLGKSVAIVGNSSKGTAFAIILFFIIPLLLIIISAAVQLILLYKKSATRKTVALPAVALILSVSGYFVIRMMIKNQIASLESQASGLLGADISGITDQLFSYKFQGKAGYYLLSVLLIILILLNLFLCGQTDTSYGRSVSPKRQREDPNLYGYRPEEGILEQHQTFQKIYEEPLIPLPEEEKGEIPGTKVAEWKNDSQQSLTINGDMKNGVLICVKGEFQGAEISIRDGETIFIGRSPDCNLILSSMKVSRKHCMVRYEANQDRYMIVNYSTNGTYINQGQLLEPEKPYYVPHGTVFRVSKDDEIFRMM